MRVLIAGDSHLARARPRQHEITDEVTNRAIGGSVATDLLRQVGGLSPAAYDAVVVSVGTNDAGWRDVALDTSLEAMALLLDWAGETPVVLVTSPGCDPARAPEHLVPDRVRQYAERLAALVSAAGGTVVDAAAVLAPLGAEAFVEDGFHLTTSAYDLLLPALRTAAGERAQTQR